MATPAPTTTTSFCHQMRSTMSSIAMTRVTTPATARMGQRDWIWPPKTTTATT